MGKDKQVFFYIGFIIIGFCLGGMVMIGWFNKERVDLKVLYNELINECYSEKLDLIN